MQSSGYPTNLKTLIEQEKYKRQYWKNERSQIKSDMLKTKCRFKQHGNWPQIVLWNIPHVLEFVNGKFSHTHKNMNQNMKMIVEIYFETFFYSF